MLAKMMMARARSGRGGSTSTLTRLWLVPSGTSATTITATTPSATIPAFKTPIRSAHRASMLYSSITMQTKAGPYYSLKQLPVQQRGMAATSTGTGSTLGSVPAAAATPSTSSSSTLQLAHPVTSMRLLMQRVMSFLVGAGLTALVSQTYIYQAIHDGNKMILAKQQQLEQRLDALEQKKTK